MERRGTTSPSIGTNAPRMEQGSHLSSQALSRRNAVQHSALRLRQAAAQALARSHQARTSRSSLDSTSTSNSVSSSQMSRITSRSNAPRNSNLLATNRLPLAANPTIHPQFRSKAVCSLFCNHCASSLCERGMRAILLGNTAVELYSVRCFVLTPSDRPPSLWSCSC
jgi:hypothetical protein